MLLTVSLIANAYLYGKATQQQIQSNYSTSIATSSAVFDVLGFVSRERWLLSTKDQITQST